MKNLFLINEEEKDRILGLHENATKRQYLSEQPTLDFGQPSQPEVTVPTLVDAGAIVKQGIGGDPYVYGKLGNDYYFAKASDGDNPNWVLATKDKAIRSIKSKIYNEKLPPVKTVKAPEKGKTKVQKPNKTVIDKERNKTVIDNTKVKRTDVDKNKVNKTNKKVVVTSKISPKFKSSLDTTKLSTTNSVKIFKAGQDNCAQFVREFINGLPKPGDAWIAHDNSSLGTTVWSAFTKLPINTRNNIINLWKKIDKKGGGTVKGPYMTQVNSIVSNLVPNSSGVNLQLNDIIGLYYPGSKHHEEAFYQGGKIFFKKDANGNPIAGNTIKGGTGWGMNTHLGVVGAIDNGTPIIFHNIGGQVYADPYTNIKGGSKIAWVKRA
jgi:hypothetical protein